MNDSIVTFVLIVIAALSVAWVGYGLYGYFVLKLGFVEAFGGDNRSGPAGGSGDSGSSSGSWDGCGDGGGGDGGGGD